MRESGKRRGDIVGREGERKSEREREGERGSCVR